MAEKQARPSHETGSGKDMDLCRRAGQVIKAAVNIKANREENSFETQATHLFQELQDEIVRGQLPPGSRLTRRELCRRFKVSQATVSEALWRLESEGLAESVPMYGTRVIPMTLQRVQDETVLREALECEVARLIALRGDSIDQKKLTAMAGQLDGLRKKSGAYSSAGMRVHQEFHIALARLTGSVLLVREVERIWRRHLAFFSWHSAAVVPPPPRWHQRLLEALFSGDPDVAERAMREHVCFGSAQQINVLQRIEKLVTRGAA